MNYQNINDNKTLFSDKIFLIIFSISFVLLIGLSFFFTEAFKGLSIASAIGLILITVIPSIILSTLLRQSLDAMNGLLSESEQEKLGTGWLSASIIFAFFSWLRCSVARLFENNTRTNKEENDLKYPQNIFPFCKKFI